MLVWVFRGPPFTHPPGPVDNDTRQDSYTWLLRISIPSPPSPDSSHQHPRPARRPRSPTHASQPVCVKNHIYPRHSSSAPHSGTHTHNTQHHVCGQNPRRPSAVDQRAHYGSLASITTTPSRPCAHPQSKLLWLHGPGRFLRLGIKPPYKEELEPTFVSCEVDGCFLAHRYPCRPEPRLRCFPPPIRECWLQSGLPA